MKQKSKVSQKKENLGLIANYRLKIRFKKILNQFFICIIQKKVKMNPKTILNSKILY